jgi:hypothetical protein
MVAINQFNPDQGNNDDGGGGAGDDEEPMIADGIEGLEELFPTNGGGSYADGGTSTSHDFF